MDNGFDQFNPAHERKQKKCKLQKKTNKQNMVEVYPVATQIELFLHVDDWLND